jgi:Trypsin-co-occurring domain 2
MSEGDAAPVSGLRLSEAIELLRDELLRARAAGAESDVQLPVESMTVQLAVTATRSAEGRAGFVVPFAGWQLGGGGGRERALAQTVTVVFAGPVDHDGHPVRVASASDLPKG